MRGVRLLAAGLVMLLPVGAFAGHTYEATYGGSGDDVAHAVLETQNGKYLLVGSSKSSGNETWDGYLVEVAPHGEQIWQKFVDLGGDEFFSDALQLDNGDLILVGQAQVAGADNRDALIVRSDSSGQITWSKTLGGSKNDAATAVAACPDGNFVFVGTTSSFGHGPSDVWVVKFTASGDTVWARTFGGNDRDEGRAVCVDGQGKITVSACSYHLGSPDVYMLQLEPNAATNWILTYGTSGWDEGYGLTLVNGLAVFAGYRYVGWGHGHDMLAVAVKASGDTAWTGHYGTNLDDYAYGAATTRDGHILLVGEKRSSSSAPKDAVVAKIDSNGHQVWLKTFAHDNSEIFYDATETNDGYYLFVGYTNSLGAGQRDAYLVKASPEGEVTAVTTESPTELPTQFPLLSNYPNPFNPSTHVRFELPHTQEIELVVKDVRGHTVKVLARGKLSAGVHGVIWQGEDQSGRPVPSGVYFCVLRSNDRVLATRKMMLLK